MKKRKKEQKAKDKRREINEAPLTWADIDAIDLIRLEVGYDLIPLVDRRQGGELMCRVKEVRKTISQSMGFLLPAVHFLDNLMINPCGYQISLAGVKIAESEVYPERELAIDPGFASQKLDGVEVKEPAFGLNGVWIDSNQRDQAQSFGYHVVSSTTLIACHVGEILKVMPQTYLATKKPASG